MKSSVGRTRMSEVLGAQTKWSEAYFCYDERHFETSDNEIRHTRASENTKAPESNARGVAGD